MTIQQDMDEQFLARAIHLAILLNHLDKVEMCNKVNRFGEDRIELSAKEIIWELLERGINGEDLKPLPIDKNLSSIEG